MFHCFADWRDSCSGKLAPSLRKDWQYRSDEIRLDILTHESITPVTGVSPSMALI